MGKVVAIAIRDLDSGCVVTAFHKPGLKRRIKWVEHFDHRDAGLIKAAVAEKEPRPPKVTMAERVVEEVKEKADDRRSR